MYAAIIKHKLRTAQGLFKHFGITIIGLIFTIGYVIVQFYFTILDGIIGTPLSQTYIFYFLVTCTILNGFRVLLKKQPIITMNAASLNCLYFTKYFKQVLAMKYILSFIKNMILTFVISSFISGFQINSIFIRYSFLICSYIFLGILLSWSRYHLSHKKPQLVIILSYIITTAIFLMENGIISIALNSFLTLFWSYYVIFKLKLNLAKYSKDLAFIDENNSAASQYDLVKISQLAVENQAKKRRKIFLYHFPLKKNTAVFYKCIIALIRVGKRIWGVFIFLLFVGFLFYRTPIFSLVPIFGEIEALAEGSAVLVVMMVYLNVGEILKEQADTLLKKYKQGLFIPIEKWRIILNYLVISILIFAFITIFAGLIFESKIFFVLLYFVLFITIFTIDFSLTLSKSKLGKVSNRVTPMLLVILGFIFII